MSALWLFPLPFQLPPELSHPGCWQAGAVPQELRGAKGPSGIWVQALQLGLLEMGLGAARIPRELDQLCSTALAQEAVLGELR